MASTATRSTVIVDNYMAELTKTTTVRPQHIITYYPKPEAAIINHDKCE